MNYEQKQSGLVVPKPKPQPAGRKRPPLEIQDEGDRAKAIASMSDLWDAMRLTEWSQFRDQAQYAAWGQAWESFGKMILGDDLPQKEVKC